MKRSEYARKAQALACLTAALERRATRLHAAKNCGTGPHGFEPGNSCGRRQARSERRSKRRRRAAKRRRLGGPKSGLTAGERQARRQRAGARRQSASTPEQAVDRREWAGELRDQRREHHADRRKEHRTLARDLRTERRTLRRGQASERRALTRRQGREEQRLSGQHDREIARYDARHPAPTPAQREARAERIAEQDRERRDQRSEHEAERRELTRTHRRERRDQRAEHRSTIADRRTQDREEWSGLHADHREILREVHQGHRDARAERLREGREGKSFTGADDDARLRGLAAEVLTAAKALTDLRTKTNPHPCRDPDGEFASCGTGGGGPKKPRKPGSKPRRSRFHTPEHGPGIDRKLAILHASEKAETTVANAVKGRHVGDYDPLRNKRKPSYDVHLPAKKSPTGRDEFLEVKYKSEGSKNALSVHADALLRKADHQAETPHSGFHTVLIDVRDRSFGGSEAHHYQGHDLYYKRGAGAYSTANMHRVKDMDELRQLIATPDDKLPETARGTMPVRTAALEAQAAKVNESRARRDSGGKKAERRANYLKRKRAGLLGTATAMPAQAGA